MYFALLYCLFLLKKNKYVLDFIAEKRLFKSKVF
jgi:hypothetical protein